mmetsp:Transcript_5165/g.16661  ORF Transcript_5165/g.16661 Transcript_5165/m.16661 type:complete len:196 (+) Transcript_5165:52-639(+)
MDTNGCSPSRLEELRQRFRVRSREQLLTLRWFVPQLAMIDSKLRTAEEIVSGAEETVNGAMAMIVNGVLDVSALSQLSEITSRLDQPRADIRGVRAVLDEVRQRMDKASLAHLLYSSHFGLTPEGLRIQLSELTDLWSAELAWVASFALAASPALGPLAASTLWTVVLHLPLRELPAVAALGPPARLLRISGESG